MEQDYEYDEPEVISSSERIDQLEQEIKRLSGGGGTDLVKIFQNPENIISELSLNEKQARNLRSFVTGTGTGLIQRYLSVHIGDVPAAIAGAAVSSWIAKKFIKSI